MTYKKSLCAILLCLCLVLTVACGSKQTGNENSKTTKQMETSADDKSPVGDHKGKALKDGVLDLATNATFPPYEFYEGTEIVGIDPDIAKAIADYLGYEFKIYDMEFSNIIASIESGKVDGGIAGMTVSEERLASVNFSDSYATGIQAVIVPQDSNIQKIEDLKGKKIGTQFGTTGDQYAQDDFGKEFVQSFDKAADAVVAMLAGNIDCVLIDNEPAKYFVNQNDKLRLLDTEYLVEDYAIAIAKDNPELLTEINQALEALKADGTLQKIIDKYIKVD